MTTAQSTDDQDVSVLEELERGLDGFSERWLADTGTLERFFDGWDEAWNSHRLDLLETLVTEDIRCEDPALFGQRVESREEFRAFLQTLFTAFPDVRFEATAGIYLALEGTGIALPWRMHGTFTGEMTAWSKDPLAHSHVTQPTGKAFDVQGVDLYQFRHGLLCDYKIVYDLLDFSAQVGIFG